MNESHGSDPANVERQCPLCEFTCDSMKVLTKHNQSIHRPYSCNICFLRFSAVYKLLDYRWMEHEISSLGASVEVGNQGDQTPEPPQPENVGATKLAEPTPEEHNQDDQMLEPPQLEAMETITPVEPTPHLGDQGNQLPKLRELRCPQVVRTNR